MILKSRTYRYLTIFQNGDLYLEISPFDSKNDMVHLYCDKKLTLKASEHVVKVKKILTFRAFIGIYPLDFLNSTCKIKFSSEPKVKIVKAYFANGNFSNLVLPNLSSLKFSKIKRLMDIHHNGYREYFKTISLEKLNSGKRSIFLSLTTSPSRLFTIDLVLERLDLSLIDIIFITIPLLYRNKQMYSLPKNLTEKYPKIMYLSEEQDFGPIMKIVSAVQFAYETFPKNKVDDAIFISIDDDQKYSKDLINFLVKTADLNPQSIVTLNHFEHLHISIGSQIPINFGKNNDGFIRPNGLMGYSGVAYRGRHIHDYKLMKFFTDVLKNPQFKNCYLSDDLVLSTFIKLRGFEIIKPINHSMVRYDFNWSKDINSLHKTDVSGKYIKAYRQNHEEKYRNCHSFIISYILDKSTMNIDYKDQIKNLYL